jgi:hypothetical protein
VAFVAHIPPMAAPGGHRDTRVRLDPGDDMTPDLPISTRELDSRTNDGLRVRLLWCESDGRVFVAVNDHRTGEAFSVEVPDDERPLQVFRHPYAYTR